MKKCLNRNYHTLKLKMLYKFKKILYIVTYNFSLFLILIIGIQNSSIRKKVNLINSQTIALPISFIVGLSYISGSLTASFLNLNLKK